MRKKIKLGLLPKVIIAIALGLLLGNIVSSGIVQFFLTLNDVFSNFLNFCIPLIIIGLVIPGIADMGQKAGKLLMITIILAYGFTLFSGFFTYFSCSRAYSHIITPDDNVILNQNSTSDGLVPFFSIEMPPVFGVMTALILAFVLGIGIAFSKGYILKDIFFDFKAIVELVITKVIIPLLPLFIFGIFLNMSYSGSAFSIIFLFGKVILVVFVLHVLLLIIMYCIAGVITKRNPFKLMYHMLPAYITALGTSSSAATIPVTLRQTIKMGVDEDVADFCVPLCATIHLSGSTMKITALSLAICMMQGLPHNLLLYSGFICMLGIVMVAAPGVPGGAIMASVAILQSILHFDENTIGLIIALYIAIDSFGTACNVTGDGSIALIVNKLSKRMTTK
ncbi:MAG: dicarboxylate/amino acid:cation symporter [Cytophagaceae bacterium]|jgi:Na+/H+-dicarboxylate symporter|nr:dicarboxylate/amino acid:cation symporter [Cytophagaceae bacterium]